MTGDNCKFITCGEGGALGGVSSPRLSPVLQLATVPPLPAPDAGHAGILLRR